MHTYVALVLAPSQAPVLGFYRHSRSILCLIGYTMRL